MGIDWKTHLSVLSEKGFALLPPLLSDDECQELTPLFDRPDLFRKAIVMQQHGYGRGEYKYFAYPLPSVVDTLRHELYRQLAPVANDWNEKLGITQRYPDTLDTWLTICHEAGQNRPTPLMLTYGAGGWNALHQDMYGDLYFPFQAVVMLSQPGQDFTGGEFVLMEQRPRMQSRAVVLQPKPGAGAAVYDQIQARKRNTRSLPNWPPARGKRRANRSADDAGPHFS